MRLYASKSLPNFIPDVSVLTALGEAVVPFIDFKDTNEFRKVSLALTICTKRTLINYSALYLQYVPSVPNDDFVAVVEGPVNFVNEGAYKFCINSDDGYALW